jgi:hypothetical protein
VNTACVYTALIGDYESLNEQPVAHRCDLDFICFTDDPALESETWKIIQVEPSWPLDAVRSARAVKILGRPELSGYSQTIWIDNSILLLDDPSFLLEHVQTTPLAVLDHFFRDTVREEFAEVIALGFDDPGRVMEQMNSYALLDHEVLDERPFATGVMIRRPCAELTATMRLWMDHILRYSRRDQLSLNCVLASTGLPVTRVTADLRACHWAQWPHTPHRDRERGLRSPLILQQEPRLLAKEVRQRERALEDRIREVLEERDVLQAEVAAAAEAHSMALDEATADRERAENEAVACRKELEEVRLELDEGRRELADADAANLRLRAGIAELVASRSWQLTQPLRRLGASIRRRRRHDS